jgi:aminoglycoside phosphotransferase (APT) family kinase protein
VTELKVQELLDRATLAADARWPGASVTDLDPLHGGVSSLTFSAQLVNGGGDIDGQRIVVKVAPPGLPPVRNRDVLRQARVLRALAGAPGVRVPEVLLEDAGAPPFFVMSFADGEAYEPNKDVSPNPPSPAIVDQRARNAARMLAQMHLLAPDAIGLGDEAEIPLRGELDRWAKLYGTAGDDLRHDETDLYQALSRNVPAPVAPRVLHGDYRLGNMQFVGDCLEAIIDWEIWSVGDPRTDLAWLLTWTDPVQRFVERRDEANQAAADAMPDRDELLSEYVTVGPGGVADLRWFLAYCYYKIASTTSVLAKRNRLRPDPDPGLEVAASTIPDVIKRGQEILATANGGWA